MTKARDLANASTALSAVSATELAFVDGVTSAIQTQLDAKAASSTSVSNAGGSTITVASGTTVPLTIQNNGTGNSLVVNDEASDTTNLVVDASGNVGIGLASPSYKLDIKETTDTNILNMTSSANANNTALRIGTSGTDVYLNASGGSTGNFTVRTYGTERMRIDGAGNVGIGKTATTKLDVNGTVNATAFTVGGAALSSGMTLISTTSFSGATTANIDNIFNSTYVNYKVIITKWNTSGNTLVLRLRYGSTTYTNANYYGSSTGINSNGTVNTQLASAATSMTLGFDGQTGQSVCDLTFHDVGTSAIQPAWTGQWMGHGNYSQIIGGQLNANFQTITGIQLLSASGNVSGTVSVYGLAK